MNCHTFHLHYTGTWKISLKFMFVSLIILIDCPQSLTNADILGQGNLDLVREKSGKCQGILLSIICGNPVNLRVKRIIPMLHFWSVLVYRHWLLPVNSP